MDWQGIAIFMAAWFAASLMLGMLLGRALRGAGEFDSEYHSQPSRMLPSPARVLPASWADTEEAVGLQVVRF